MSFTVDLALIKPDSIIELIGRSPCEFNSSGFEKSGMYESRLAST